MRFFEIPEYYLEQLKTFCEKKLMKNIKQDKMERISQHSTNKNPVI